MGPTGDTRGILNPSDGLQRFSLERPVPPEGLRPWVDRFWIVRWRLAAGERHEQEILPHPSVQLAFEAHGATVHGIGTRRFVARLEGWGRVIGVKLLPGAFTAFSARPMADLVDRVLPLADVFGERAGELSTRVSSEPDTQAALASIGAFLESLDPAHDDNIARVVELVELVARERSITRSEALARQAGSSVRSLQRLFERYLGVGPKWVIARARVQEAAERIAAGGAVDFAALAVELGYHDQAHLIRDFKAQVGFTPAVYAQRCSAGRAGGSSSEG
jgi:AraC-like DNA-binding protein